MMLTLSELVQFTFVSGACLVTSTTALIISIYLLVKINKLAKLIKKGN